MNITVTDQENCKKQLHLEIPGEVVRAETDKVAGNLARQINIPGFRPGHAPKSVIKTRFRKELRDEVVSHLLPESLQKAISDKDLKVIGEPAIDDLKFGDDDRINVTITVSVKPEFELGDYKGLPLTKRVYKIRDEDVDREIERLREAQAELVPVEDRGAASDDIVTVSLVGRIERTEAQQAEAQPADDVAQPSEEAAASDEAATEAAPQDAAAAEPEEIKQDDVEITVGGANVLKEFTEALTGARPGDERSFTVTYPAEYKPERFAGRTVAYTANVTAVRAKELPAADDVFAQEVDEKFQTLDELRADLRQQMEHSAEHRTEDETRAAAMEALIERYQFDVPEFIVERQINSRFNTLLDQLFQSGIDPRQMQLDWQEIRNNQRERAERDVRGMFILDRIADDEKIEVSDEDLNHEIEEYAAQRGESVAAAKARLTKEEALDSIKEQVRQQKALDLVIASADLKTEEVAGLRAADTEAEPPAEAAADADAGAQETAEASGE
ncbi:MAG TPA: trigger factor [Blastocatellia bacterium]|nr:trigger factor [Blastocatellia bacterium]